jgi:hypothetical protein
MFKARIQSPMSGERVEEVIFNVPSTMACFPKLTTGELRKREGGCSPSMMIFDGFDPFLADPFSFGDGLIGMEHTQQYFHASGRAKAFYIPELCQPSGLVPQIGLHLRKQTLRVLK